MAARSHPLCLGSRRKATIDHSLLCIHHNQSAFPLATFPFTTSSISHVTRLPVAVSLPWRLRMRPLRGPCAWQPEHADPCTETRFAFRSAKDKERLLHSCAAAATTTATAIITIVVQLLPKHYVAFPPTSRCCRSSINASHVRLITIWLIWSVFYRVAEQRWQ